MTNTKEKSMQIITEKKEQIFYYTLYLGFSIMLYFPMISKYLCCPDGVWQGIFYKAGYQWEMALGRYGIGLLQGLRSGVINTSFVTLLSLVLLSLGILLVTEAFSLRSFFPRVLIGLVLVAAPSVGNVLTFYYCSDFYMLSYLLAILSFYLMVLPQKKIVYCILSCVCLTLSISIYQAYMCVTILLCVFYLLKELLKGTDFRQMKQLALRMGCTGACGILLYLFSNRIVQRMFRIAAVDSRGFDEMGTIHPMLILRAFGKSYPRFWEYFFGNEMLNNDWGGRREVNIAFSLLALVYLIYRIVRTKIPVWQKYCAMLVLVLMPPVLFSITCIAPLACQGTLGPMILPTMNYFYVLPLLLWEEKNPLRVTQYIAVPLVLWTMIVFQVSSQSYMEYNMMKTYSVASQMVSEIERVRFAEEECADYPIFILGNMENGNYPEQQEELRQSVRGTIAFYRMLHSDDNGRNQSWRYFISQFMGRDYDIWSMENVQELKQTQQVQEMKVFPAEGSVAVVDGVIVVKLSEG